MTEKVQRQREADARGSAAAGALRAAGKGNRAVARYSGVIAGGGAGVVQRSPASSGDRSPGGDWMSDPMSMAALGLGAGSGLGSTGQSAGGAPVVQLSPDGSSDAAAAADKVDVSVTWYGKFGGDLSAKVTLEGEKSKNKWENLSSSTVSDPDLGEGEVSQELDTSLEGKRFSRYRITVEPTAARPEDRYRKTSKIIRVGADADSASARIKLPVNRWNHKNVDDVWEDKNIDPDKAARTTKIELFGRSITVNELVVPRVERTQALFEALPAETQEEIKASIAIMGGYARRTTSTGVFSNHSTGCAIDINYNMDTRQNHHFHTSDEKPHLTFVETVVRTHPDHASFNINAAKGQDQLKASEAFNQRFPFYVAELIDLDTSPKFDEDPSYTDYMSMTWWMQQLAALLESLDGRQVLAQIQPADLQAALKKTEDADKKARLREVIKYWSYSKAWIEGVQVHDRVADEDKTLTGMIPLHESLLQIFLDAGWKWGGDWGQGAKDYMHFEDREALDGIQQSD